MYDDKRGYIAYGKHVICVSYCNILPDVDILEIMNNLKTYDCAIIGGGPAGQSAAIYLARFNRSVVVFDRGTSRTLSFEFNENYLGFPDGIHSRELYQLGRQQAERFGVPFTNQSVQSLAHNHDTNLFTLSTDTEHYSARSLLIATGVTDLYPNLPNHELYWGKSLFWCITCDGYKTRNKKIIVVGDNDEVACTALQFLNYTPDVTVVTNYTPDQVAMSRLWRQRLWDHHIPLHEATITQLEGVDGNLTAIQLSTGVTLPVEIMFNMQGAVPNNALATQLGVQVNGEGYIETSDEQRTNVPFVYAAGDVTRMFSHQIVTAAHEGSMAAQAINYDLYQDFQRME
jgi:thioredoxin reductase (NADPH)